MLDILIPIVTPLLSVVGVVWVGILTYKGSRKTADVEAKLKERVLELEKVQVNAAAFTQAKDFYLEMIETLKSELLTVRTRAEALDKELTSEKEVSENLRDEIDKLQDAIESLEAQLMEAKLKITTLTA